jgi:hypothetical protein
MPKEILPLCRRHARSEARIKTILAVPLKGDSFQRPDFLRASAVKKQTPAQQINPPRILTTPHISPILRKASGYLPITIC